MQQVIVLPSGKQVGLRAYAKAWRQLKTLPPDTVIRDWSWHSNTAAEVLRELEHGLQDRINRHDRMRPRYWRRLQDQWQRDTANLARKVNTPRLIVHQAEVPMEYRKRLAHSPDQKIRSLLED